MQLRVKCDATQILCRGIHRDVEPIGVVVQRQNNDFPHHLTISNCRENTYFFRM